MNATPTIATGYSGFSQTRIDHDTEDTAARSDTLILPNGNLANVWSEKDASGVYRIFYSLTDLSGADVLSPIELETTASLSILYIGT